MEASPTTEEKINLSEAWVKVRCKAGCFTFFVMEVQLRCSSHLLHLLSFAPEELPLRSILRFCDLSDVSIVSNEVGKVSESAPLILDKGIDDSIKAVQEGCDFKLLSRSPSGASVGKGEGAIEADEGFKCMIFQSTTLGPVEQLVSDLSMQNQIWFPEIESDHSIIQQPLDQANKSVMCG